MKSKFRFILPSLLFISVFCGSLTGATLYVATTGDDTNGNGSQVAPYSTIQKAVDSASNGDAILVLPGTYAGSGNREINTLGKLITIQSSDGPLLTIVDCGNKQAFIANSGETQDTIIDGFSITNGYVSSGRDWSGLGIIHMENCAYTIRNCIFYDNSAVATYSTTSMAIIYKHSGDSEAGLVENCLFYNNSISDIRWTSFGGGFGGLAIGNSGGGINPLDVNFCTFADNTLNNSGGITMISYSGGTISNSVEYNNQGLYWRGEPTKAFYGPEVSYCLTSHDVPDGSIGVLSGDPIFLSEGGIDYALSAGSPAIDSGDPSLLDPDGSRADMGFRLDRFTSTTDTEAPQFQIIGGSFTWPEAKADAESRGGRLAVLNTQGKIDAAQSFLDDLGQWPEFYIGLTDQDNEGDWRWIDGTILSASNWTPGEPSNSANITGQEDFVVSSNDPNYAGKYGDQSDTYRGGGYLLEIVSDDTDGDGLLDSVETNTGVYISETDTGTDPNNADSDGDGLSDGVETNTGIYVSGSDTGTYPNNVDVLYNATQVNTSVATSRTLGQQDVTTAPGDFGLHTPAEMSSNRTLGQQDVTSNPSDYNLHTPSEMTAARSESRTLGQQDVTTTPSNYNLHTSAEMTLARSESRTAGQQDVISSPSDYNLMGAEGVFDMRVSQPGISTNGDKASMNFTIQSSNDLEEWNNEGNHST